MSIARAFSPRYQQTMLRIKDPRKSVPWYQQNFHMKLVHWISFPQWKFTVYFLERQREGQVSPECTLEQATLESEKYLNNMTGAALELTHNHGSEDDPAFTVWNGNTGRDAGEPGSANYAHEPAARGFGHIAFNCDDVYEACETLEKAGVKFQKKPDEGRMKGLAFALDPDGYWIELVRRAPIFPGVGNYFNFSQTMLRVKDGAKSVAFYRDMLGMTCIRARELPQYKFSLFFMVSATEEELKAAFNAQTPEQQKESAPGDGTWATFDPTQNNEMTKVMWNHALELTYNHGTELDPNFRVHDGNAAPQGFGHTGFLCDNIDAYVEALEAAGVAVKKRPSDGNMRGLAFVYDPDGYWVELIDRSASFAGVCSNY